MKLFQLLQSSLQKRWIRILAIAAVSGLVNAVILGTINSGAFGSGKGSHSIRGLVMFAICMLAYYTAKRYAMVEGCQAAEMVLSGMLSRIAQKIRQSELPVIEEIIHSGDYQAIANDTTVISQATMVLINVAQQSIMMVMCLFYIAIISPLNFAVCAAAICVAILVYSVHSRHLTCELSAQRKAESHMTVTLEDVVDGFKEVRLNSERSSAVGKDLRDIAADLYRTRMRTNSYFCTDMMFADLFFYMLLATVVFVLPNYQHGISNQTLMTVGAIFFIMSPLQAIVGSSPIVMRSSVSIDHLESFEAMLDDAASRRAVSAGGEERETDGQPIGSIQLDNIVFKYPAVANGDGVVPDSFQIGPFSLEVKQGEILFLVGGNGCGKTTFLKTITGLYMPTAGRIVVDGVPVTARNLSSYRSRVAAIFSDFHLFQRLYGYEDVDPATVDALLSLLKIDDKVSFCDGRFTSLKLSTGQRKRLALVVALLEGRDILVLDEWAADQDPSFRAYFYETLLPDLKAQGKTIIAVSHDDRYWHLADRVVRLEYGAMA